MHLNTKRTVEHGVFGGEMWSRRVFERVMEWVRRKKRVRTFACVWRRAVFFCPPEAVNNILKQPEMSRPKVVRGNKTNDI